MFQECEMPASPVQRQYQIIHDLRSLRKFAAALGPAIATAE
jgi:hypothetical protein